LDNESAAGGKDGTRLTAMRLLAPAKINLHLRVGSRRPADGFHPLLTWMTTVGLFDTLEFERARGPAEFSLTTDKAALPTDEQNLVVRAARAFAQALAATAEEGWAAAGVTGLSAVLRKRIPVGAGLGGGSSDAARTLLGLNWLWEADWSLPNLAEFSARFGSDLPFFFYGPSGICTGRGEIVRPVAVPARARTALLILPEFGVSTADAYRAFDALNAGAADDAAAMDSASEPDWQEWATLPARQLLERLVNDLEPAAFAVKPQLSKLRADIQSQIDRVVRMSGSGSTLFTLYDDPSEAESAMTQLRQHFAHCDFFAASIAPDVPDDVSKNKSRTQ
jgi:4-diphosphocytidyl-2-C-methyl-D-erythritol kinase